MEPPKRASGFVNPPPRKRPAAMPDTASNQPPAAADGHLESQHPRTDAVQASATRKNSNAQAKRPGREKREIVGDYLVGFGRPPKNQFKPGNKGGPGRPPGSKSQNSLLRAEFDRKHPVKEGGKTIKTSARQLISRLVVTGPITSRDHRDLAKLNALARDLYPDPVSDTAVAEAYDPALDQFVLQHLFASLQLGQENAPGSDPLADRATGRTDVGQSVGGDAWDEGDWDGDPEEVSDGKR